MFKETVRLSSAVIASFISSLFVFSYNKINALNAVYQEIGQELPFLTVICDKFAVYGMIVPFLLLIIEELLWYYYNDKECCVRNYNSVLSVPLW